VRRSTPRKTDAVPDVLTESHRLQKELWRVRVEAARSRYETTAEELRRAVENGSQGDAWQEILEVRFREADALSEYLTAMRMFTEITQAQPS
jgi:hypothetical protein